MEKIKTCDKCRYNDESLCGIFGVDTSKKFKGKCPEWRMKHSDKKMDSGTKAKIDRLATRALIISLTKKDCLDAEGKPLNCGKCEEVNPAWRKALRFKPFMECSLFLGRNVDAYLTGDKRHPDCDIEPLSVYIKSHSESSVDKNIDGKNSK